MRILWTHHSEERQKDWEKRLGITRRHVEDVIWSSEQIAAGYRGTLVAQSRCANVCYVCPLSRRRRSVRY